MDSRIQYCITLAVAFSAGASMHGLALTGLALCVVVDLYTWEK